MYTDECTELENICPENTQCVNTVGSYECRECRYTKQVCSECPGNVLLLCLIACTSMLRFRMCNFYRIFPVQIDRTVTTILMHRAIVTNGVFTAYMCDSASELRCGVVRAVGRGIAVLHRGPRRASGREGFGGFLFPICTMGNDIGSPTVKCFRFVCENFTTFSSANLSLESSIRGLYGGIFAVKINGGVYEKLPTK